MDQIAHGAQQSETGWTAAMEAMEAMEAKFGPSIEDARGLDVRVGEVHCAATACPVLLDHRCLSGQQDLMLGLDGRPGFDFAGLAHLEWVSDGSAVSYRYVHGSDYTWPPRVRREDEPLSLDTMPAW